MSTKHYRWGFCGAGAVARQFARSLASLPNAAIHGVVARSASSAGSFSARFGAPHAYDDASHLFADADVDIVYISTPPELHREHCLEAIEAGKAVLCEKPLCMNAEEATGVAAAARARQVFCMEAMWMRFIPLVQQVKQAIHAGELGDVQCLAAELGFPMQKGPAGGHVLLDLGVYPVSLGHFLFGKATGYDVQPNSDATHCVATLRYGDVTAPMICSSRARLSNDATITGTAGRLHIQEPLYSPYLARVQRWPEESAAADDATAAAGAGKSSDSATWAELRRRVLLPVRRLLGVGFRTLTAPFRGFGYQFEAAEVMACLDAAKTESEMMPLSHTIEVLGTVDGLIDRTPRAV